MDDIFSLVLAKLLPAVQGFAGIIVGSLLTYLVSTRVATRQLVKQRTLDFFNADYLPLLAAVSAVVMSDPCKLRQMLDAREDMPLDKKDQMVRDCEVACCRYLRMLYKALSDFLESGALIILMLADFSIAEQVMALYGRVDAIGKDLGRPEVVDDGASESLREYVLPLVPAVRELLPPLAGVRLDTLQRHYAKLVRGTALADLPVTSGTCLPREGDGAS